MQLKKGGGFGPMCYHVFVFSGWKMIQNGGLRGGGGVT